MTNKKKSKEVLTLDSIQKNIKRFVGTLFTRKNSSLSIALATLIAIYGFYQLEIKDSPKIMNISHSNHKDFKGRKIIGSGESIYKRKENLISSEITTIRKRLKKNKDNQKKLESSISKLESSIDSLKKALVNGQNKADAVPTQNNTQKVSLSNPNIAHMTSIPKDEQDNDKNTQKNTISKQRGVPQKKRYARGPAIISFPVESKSEIKRDQVTIPTGSFVNATMLTGVESPEGKALPVLLKANEAYIGPNKTRIDLSGCFFIGKSTGNLSIERVELQIVRISCVSKSGRSFEKEVSGFVADSKDNSFAVRGSVNGKRNRVAALAFLSSIVEGVGKAIQQSQMSTAANAASGAGGPMVTGNQTKHMLAGGAATAAGRVTQFYLKHAESLLPTINVGSGREVYIVMQQKIGLPNWYFRKIKGHKQGDDYYLSNILN